MIDPERFPIVRRWPAAHPDRIQLYSLNTPNGVKASIMLEECGLPYEPHLVDIGKDESKDPAFVSLNPNGRIPALIDPDGPGGVPVGLFESGAILLYLAEKTGRFLPADPAARWETVSWLMWQMGGVGPMFGQIGYFHRYAGREIADKRPLDRYLGEARRLLGVLDARLRDREWIMGNGYTIADIAVLGWVRALVTAYDVAELVGLDGFAEVVRWRDAGLARPAVQRGLAVPARS